MKKIIALVLILLLVFASLVGCSNKKEDLALDNDLEVEDNKDKDIVDQSKINGEKDEEVEIEDTNKKEEEGNEDKDLDEENTKEGQDEGDKEGVEIEKGDTGKEVKPEQANPQPVSQPQKPQPTPNPQPEKPQVEKPKPEKPSEPNPEKPKDPEPDKPETNLKVPSNLPSGATIIENIEGPARIDHAYDYNKTLSEGFKISEIFVTYYKNSGNLSVGCYGTLPNGETLLIDSKSDKKNTLSYSYYGGEKIYLSNTETRELQDVFHLFFTVYGY